MLLSFPSSLTGQDTGDIMRKGNDALNAGLWEMAAIHFDQCLSGKDLNATIKSEIAIRLVEALVRDGKAEQALEVLGQSFVSQNSEAPFWKGMAFFSLGRLGESAVALTPLLSDSQAPHHEAAGFSLESIQLALGLPDAALETLSVLANSLDPLIACKARLHKVEILLDLGRNKEAVETMPASADINSSLKAQAIFLEAQLQLAAGRFTEAAAGFQSLVDQPQGQTVQRYHLAALGLADALHAGKSPTGAEEFLLDFIQNHPESAYLQAMFGRLLAWLPPNPSVTHPILERLAKWITPSADSFSGAIAEVNSGAVAAWPEVPAESSELLVHSLFARALGLHRSGSPEAQAQARSLLSRLRLENPEHFLANYSLLELARWLLDKGLDDRAIRILETLREIPNSSQTHGQAAFLEAGAFYSRGDNARAARLFKEAAENLAEQDAKAAAFNAAVVSLNEISTTNTVIQTDSPQDSAVTADLELERALSTREQSARYSAIENFLIKFPDHSRIGELRIAATEAALAIPSPDLPAAKKQLDLLEANAESSANMSPARIAWIKLRISDLSNDPPAAIVAARAFLTQFPGDPAAPDAAFMLGRNLFQTRSYNDARIVLEKFASSQADSALAQAAWLLAARSAALVPTSQSQQEAITLFDKVINSKGTLSSVAMLEKSRLLIDMNRLTEAAEFLRQWFEPLKPNDPLHLPAGLLLGEAAYAQGSANPNSLQDALEVYDKLLADAGKEPAVFNRIQYLRGRTLEQIPDAKDSSRKREKEAFIAYYSVLETTKPPAEWYYFELCGFRALALLESANRWPAAIACAKKIASFKGPRAEEAAAHASQLQLKHMIWED